MTEYLVKDQAGNTFGPADLATLKQWIHEHRVTPKMSLAIRGTNLFKPATAYPELQDTFASSPYAHLYTAKKDLTPTPAPTAPSAPQTPNNQYQIPAQTTQYPIPAQAPRYPIPAQTPQYPIPQYPQQTLSYGDALKQTGMAMTSMILGIVAVIMLPLAACWLPLSPVVAIVGIIMGHAAKAQINRAPSQYGGEGMATAGLIMGYISVALGCLGFSMLLAILLAGFAASSP